MVSKNLARFPALEPPAAFGIHLIMCLNDTCSYKLLRDSHFIADGHVPSVVSGSAEGEA